MSSKTATPRVNAPRLASHIDQTVRIIGRVEEIDGNDIKIEASGPVDVHVTSGEPVELGKVYEFVAKVADDKSVKSFSHADMGTTEYHSTLIDRVIEAEHQNPELFA